MAELPTRNAASGTHDAFAVHRSAPRSNFLPEMILSVRHYWPEGSIEVCTNGLNPKRHAMVPFILAQPNMG